MRTRVLALLPALLLAASPGFSFQGTGPRPNIVLVMTDDQGWAQVGFHGDPVLQTPHIDRLAGESVEMTRFYVSPGPSAPASCSPIAATPPPRIAPSRSFEAGVTTAGEEPHGAWHVDIVRR